MDALTVILTLILGFFIVRYVFFRKPSKFEKYGVVHDKSWPLMGNTIKTMLRRLSFAELIRQIYFINDDETTYIGYTDFAGPKIMIRSPELIKTVAIKNFDHFVDHFLFLSRDQEPLFSNNLFSLTGDHWRHMRHLLSPAFTSSKMKGMYALMTKVAEDFGDYITARASKGPYVEDFKSAFTKYTNDVIASCAFGISVDSMKNPDNEFYVTAQRAISFQTSSMFKFLVLSKCPALAKLFGLQMFDTKVEKFFENIVKETIDTRDREGITRPDMIQLMMESRGTNAIGNRDLTTLEMTAQAFIFFLGGFDSSSNAMAFAAYEIAINPHVQKKLHAEIDAVLEETHGKPTYEAINAMEYLDAILSEVLRLYPSFPFMDRQCTKAYDLPPAYPGGKSYTVETGETVVFPVYAIHRDPKYFPEPDSFQPERFIGDRKNDIDPLTYFPFGLGPRMCIGNRFALLQTKVVLFHLMAKCLLKPSEKTGIPLELTTKSFVMAPKNGFILLVEKRNNQSR